MSDMKNILRLNPEDNVVLALSALGAGQQIEGGEIQSRTEIPAGHKVATSSIAKGDAVRKYGQIIGFATSDVAPGDHVHTHNCGMGDYDKDYAFGRDLRNEAPLEAGQQRVFDGFARAGGQVGTRNYVGILTSVNCSASVARFIAREAENRGLLDAYPNVDGIVPLIHGTGCGMAASGDGFDNLKRVLWGYATHPNFAAVLMVGLGCEVFEISRFMDAYNIQSSHSFRSFTIQASGGTRKTVADGVAALEEILPVANEARRQKCPASALKLALQCGGSDAYSGITANPALGVAADLLVQQGGTSILSETPEIYGAEHLLTSRAVSKEVGEKLLDRIHWWEDYSKRSGGEMNNNPSPGNKAGGLTTILEKSLGAAAKGGKSNLQDVYLYGEKITTSGFVFMDSPGYDPCSITGQVASGANLVCFTTGRGSAFGYKPVPSVKLATNSTMYRNMQDDMDINCGDIIDDNVSISDKGAEIFDYLLEIASGRQSKSEQLGYGDNEFVPWQIGATM